MLSKTSLFLHFHIIQHAMHKVSKTIAGNFFGAASITSMNLVLEGNL